MRSRHVAAALFACLALAAAGAKEKPAPAAPTQEELRQLRERIDRLQKDLARAEESRGEAADALKASEKAVSEANRALFELAAGKRALEGDLAQLARRGEAARAGIAAQQALAEKLLRLQYESGGADRLRLLLEGRDLADLSRQLTYYGYIQQARALALAQLKAGAEEIAALESAAREKRAALAENESAQARETKRLEM